MYGAFGRKINKFTVIYGAYIRFWPTLVIYWQMYEMHSNKFQISTCMHIPKPKTYTQTHMHRSIYNLHKQMHEHMRINQQTHTHTHIHTHTSTRAYTPKHTYTHSPHTWLLGWAPISASMALSSCGVTRVPRDPRKCSCEYTAREHAQLCCLFHIIPFFHNPAREHAQLRADCCISLVPQFHIAPYSTAQSST